MIGEPPLLAGAVKATDAEPLPAVAVAPVGAPGAVGLLGGAVGVTDEVALEGTELPAVFVATTVKV